jgi:hypothetical protein
VMQDATDDRVGPADHPVTLLGRAEEGQPARMVASGRKTRYK